MTPLAWLAGPWGPLIRLGLIAAAFLGAFGLGYVKGLLHAQKTEAAYHAKVEALADAAVAKNAQTARQEREVTNAVIRDYQANIMAIRRASADRLRKSAGSGAVSAVSGSATGTDARAADAAVIEQCAETTQQLISLQEWIRKQAAVH